MGNVGLGGGGGQGGLGVVGGGACLEMYGGERNNATSGAEIAAYVSGLIAAIGWWCFIDAAIFNSGTTDAKCTLSFAMWLPGIGATLGVVMINCFNYSAYTNTGDGGSAAACNIASTWVMVEYWLDGNSCTNWPGVA